MPRRRSKRGCEALGSRLGEHRSSLAIASRGLAGAGPSGSLTLGRALGLTLGLTLAGCSEPAPPRLVAQLGCGLDDAGIGTLRVQARGDFPPSGGTQVLFSDGEQFLRWGELPVQGVTVEGLFGQTVEAVGRTARLRELGDIPVYFAPVDGVCPVEGTVASREAVAVAVGPEGDVIAVGGRDEGGRLLDDVVHLYDEEGRARLLSGGLPFPSVGQSVHGLADRRFLVIGGAGSNRTALDDVVVIDLEQEDDPVGDPVPIAVPSALGPARAFHAAALDPEGRVLVMGGCRRLTPQAACATDEEPGATLPNLPPQGLWIDPRPLEEGGLPTFDEGPEQVVPRFGATLMFARDGVGFLAGGYDQAGRPVHVVERLQPGGRRFRRYGDGATVALPDGLAVTGATLLDGGTVVLVMGDGRIHWVTEQGRDEVLPWEGWCDGEGPCFADVEAGEPAAWRGVLTMPGERVLADGVLLPVAGVGDRGIDRRDPFVPGPSDAMPPPRRLGSVPALLSDGSVLLLGGRDAETGALAEPFALRVRPALDGPDERIPEVDRLAKGSLVARDLDRVAIEGETLRLLASEDLAVPFPHTRAHARGFRSAQFRFEVTLQVTVGEVVPHVVLGHGGSEAIDVSLGADRVAGHVRSPTGVVQDFSCAPSGMVFDTPQVLRVEVRPDGIVLRRGTEVLAQCPGVGEGRTWSVGVGASGTGELLASGMRLTRL